MKIPCLLLGQGGEFQKIQPPAEFAVKESIVDCRTVPIFARGKRVNCNRTMLDITRPNFSSALIYFLLCGRSLFSL